MEGDGAPDEKTLRYLKALVTILTVTMIGGFLTIVGLFVMRFTGSEDLGLPDEITLPDDVRAAAFTKGADWFAVVTEGDEILIFDRATGVLVQRIVVRHK